MSYRNDSDASHRAATAIAVAALEATAIFAIVSALSVTFKPQSTLPNPTATNIPMPLPTPTQKAKPVVRQRHDASQPVHDPLAPPVTDPLTPPIPQPTGSIVPTPQPTPDAVPEQPRQPPFVARAPRPIGHPSTWATPDDYPSRDLHENHSGVTGFRLTVGSDGKVVACVVTASSGYPGLDRATCEFVSRRAQFEPAVDSMGARVAGSYANSIHWVIPD